MESPFSARLVQMLGDVSRNLRTGHLLLGDEAAGSLRFTNGELAGFEPPRDLGQPLPAPGDVAALRRCLEQAARHALARGGAPTFRPSRADEPAAPPLPAGLAAADLALDFCRLIQDVAWLEQHLKGSADDRLRPPAQPPVLQPRLALGASEGFLLSRADGSLTLQQIRDTAPFEAVETLRALFALKEVGMLAWSGAQHARAAAGASQAKIPDLDRFLKRTSGSVQERPSSGDAPAQPAQDLYDAEQMAERAALLERCQSTKGMEHYAILGIDRTANETVIRHAYYQLARRYHPDRLLRPHLEDIHGQLEAMFAAITEAYNTLSDPAARAEYEREMIERAAGRRKEPTLDKSGSARDSFVRGRRLLDAGKTFEALRLFESAVGLDGTRAEYFHYLGLCQAQNPRWRKKAEESLCKAIEINPGSPQTYLQLARLYKKGGLERRAVEIYEKLLTWEPTNEEALQATGRSKDQGSATGVFRSIFKKE